MNKIWLVPITVSSAIFIFPPARANAGFCDYPAVTTAAPSFLVGGAYCDWPTEINGSHLHCEQGGVGVNSEANIGGPATLGLGGAGVGGLSCTWRCPDNSMAPAPNPPGAWKWILWFLFRMRAKIIWNRLDFRVHPFFPVKVCQFRHHLPQR